MVAGEGEIGKGATKGGLGRQWTQIFENDHFSKSIFFDDSAPSKLDTFETVSFSLPPRPQKQRPFGFSHKNAWISQVC